MMVDPSLVCSDGFFINFSHLLLKFCEPFLNPGSKIPMKIDCRYGCIAASLQSIFDPNTPLHMLKGEEIEPMVTKPDDGMLDFSY